MTTHGFELVAERDVAEIKSKALLYRHAKTGAQLLSLVNDDENKVFGITFRTPPKDSTGVAHILEHSVLCGSRKYPVKEPFVELLKSSLKTFRAGQERAGQLLLRPGQELHRAVPRGQAVYARQRGRPVLQGLTPVQLAAATRRAM